MSEGKKSSEAIFIDTNIWLYAFIHTQNAGKHRIAKQLIRSKNIVVSTQIINEVCINLIKKAKLTEKQIQSLIESFYARYQIVELTREILIDASRLRDRYTFSFWDSLVLATGLFVEASTLYSEDMQDGLIIENKMTIVNSFK